MKLICALLSVMAVAAIPSPRRLVLMSRSMSKARAAPGVLGVQSSQADRSVTGMCSAAQDSIGVLREAGSSGISTVPQCAQYGKDRTSSLAIFVSFSASLDTCMWFTDCQCLVSSSTCLGGDQWKSVAISDVVGTSSTSSSSVVETTAAPIATSAIIWNSQDPHSQSAAPSGDFIDCDTANSNSLMQSFQTKCQMTQTVWATRMIAGGTLIGIILLVGGVFGLAYYFDKQELNAMMMNK